MPDSASEDLFRLPHAYRIAKQPNAMMAPISLALRLASDVIFSLLRTSSSMISQLWLHMRWAGHTQGTHASDTSIQPASNYGYPSFGGNAIDDAEDDGTGVTMIEISALMEHYIFHISYYRDYFPSHNYYISYSIFFMFNINDVSLRKVT